MSGLSDPVYKSTEFKDGINSEKAIDIALEHAGLTHDEVSSLSVELPQTRTGRYSKLNSYAVTRPIPRSGYADSSTPTPPRARSTQ